MKKIMNIFIKIVIEMSVINEPDGSLCKVFISFPSGAQVICMYTVCVCVSYISYLNLVVHISENWFFMCFCAITTTATRITFFFATVLFIFKKFLNSYPNFQISFKETFRIIVLKIRFSQISLSRQ